MKKKLLAGALLGAAAGYTLAWLQACAGGG